MAWLSVRCGVLACVVLCGACVSNRAQLRGVGVHPSVNPGPRPATEPAPPGAPDGPGATPRWLIISPLTRLGTDASGTPAIVLHLELRDGAGQAVRAPGQVRVELFAPGASTGGAPSQAGAPGDEAREPERIWEIELDNPDTGDAGGFYDELITRTYALPLTGLPDWLIAWSQGEGDAAEARRDAPASTARSHRPEVSVWFTFDVPARVLTARTTLPK